MIHRLMNNNITSKDRDVLVKFIQNTDYFTNGKTSAIIPNLGIWFQI